MLGAAAWRKVGPFTLRTQGEFVHLGVTAANPWSAIVVHNHLGRGWVGALWQGEGSGFWRGLGLSLDLGYTENPFRTGLPRVDNPGWQIHGGIQHRALALRIFRGGQHLLRAGLHDLRGLSLRPGWAAGPLD